jgi:hypothetical protein
MKYRVEVGGEFTFTDQSTTLEIQGLRLDLTKIETIEEWRTVLYGIAIRSLERIARKDDLPPKVNPAPVQRHVAAATAMGDLEEQFRKQRESLAEQTEKLQQDINSQYRELSSSYESALDAAGIRKQSVGGGG